MKLMFFIYREILKIILHHSDSSDSLMVFFFAPQAFLHKLNNAPWPSYYLCLRGMIKNNVDFCYKKLYSQHRLIQTIPFCFGNCLGSDKIFVLILFIPLVHGLFLLPWLRAPGAVQ